ncbi:hypothetical protein Poli38472_009273 [Pythium oligandrum]|uniref:Uncharacterized protein n=1 Tax=Pythium oligandrum TaxID=41045 RepID=A0A8K1CK51_PYTOL|nr:hypothetical protein Poli38472_009273 [Pythium oligandrum]|eukprot:TMW65106.1 hypothetical protein Poli38472_009273 [Pythium oligandrum]
MAKKRRCCRFSFVKLILVALNLASTALTLMSGLRENPALVFLTGRYDPIRQRLREGTINNEIADHDIYRLSGLTSYQEVGDNFRFISLPRRDPASVGQKRSVCMNINSVNASIMGIMYDDFWGKGPRRIQIYVFSISAVNCKVLNVKPAWVQTCIKSNGNTTTGCHNYILSNFEQLQRNRSVIVGSMNDFGTSGTPFLKCYGRPKQDFDFQADLVTHQTFWAGGEYHLQIQTSDCKAKPLLPNPNWDWSLFQVEGVDDGSDVVLAIPPPGWFTSVITLLYSIASVVLILLGIVSALLQTRAVRYIPDELRYSNDQKIARYLTPFMPISALLTDDVRSIITFKGSLLIASDVWMNHWLYIILSMLDVVTNLRYTYAWFQIGTWYLLMKVTVENFIFLTSVLTKMAWLMCLVHTVIRFFLKVAIHTLRSMQIIRTTTRDKLQGYIDGSSMFLSFKIYNIMLCIILLLIIQVRGTATLMVRSVPSKIGTYGGIPKIPRIWGSEMMCDFATIFLILAACGQVIGAVFMLTRFRLVTENRVMRLLQKRYVVVGWDGLMTASMLGLDPTTSDIMATGRPRTNCSLGTLLQLLYLSGPSAFVRLAGDYIFSGYGFSSAPLEFHFPVKRAVSMGLLDRAKGSTYRSKDGASNATDIDNIVNRSAVKPASISMSTRQVREEAETTPRSEDDIAPLPKRSIFQRELKIVTDGYFGKMYIIDEADAGTVITNKETGMREYVVTDALATISIVDIKWVLGNKKGLFIA